MEYRSSNQVETQNKKHIPKSFLLDTFHGKQKRNKEGLVNLI